jgi:alpha-L-rhamnosidase
MAEKLNVIMALRVINLQVEYSVNPLGVDLPRPRFSWGFESNQRKQCQTAFQLLAASDEDELVNHKGDLWDSGKDHLQSES